MREEDFASSSKVPFYDTSDEVTNPMNLSIMLN